MACRVSGQMSGLQFVLAAHMLTKDLPQTMQDTLMQGHVGQGNSSMQAVML